MRALLIILALAPALALAQSRPTYQAVGAAAITASTTTCTPATTNLGTVGPTDIIFLAVQSENEAISLTTANGFVQVTNSPQSSGTAATDPATRLAVYWVRGSSWTAAPVVADSGDHTSCMLIRFAGALETGNPWACTAGAVDTASNTTGTFAGCAPGTAQNYLVVLFAAPSNNATATTNCSAWTNANLANITEVYDSTNTAGLGGGICIATGQYGGSTTFGSSTVTFSVATWDGLLAVVLAPGTDPPPGTGGMMGFFP